MSGIPDQYRAGLLITSDRASSGERPDQCEATVRQVLEQSALQLIVAVVTSDDPETIAAGFEKLLKHQLDLIFTCGGTGCSPRDNTPEVTRRFVDKRTPGIDEAIRQFSSDKTAFAMYSRAISGIAGQTLIINLPGAPRAVREIIEFLLPSIEHPLRLVQDRVADCETGDVRQ